MSRFHASFWGFKNQIKIGTQVSLGGVDKVGSKTQVYNFFLFVDRSPKEFFYVHFCTLQIIRSGQVGVRVGVVDVRKHSSQEVNISLVKVRQT